MWRIFQILSPKMDLIWTTRLTAPSSPAPPYLIPSTLHAPTPLSHPLAPGALPLIACSSTPDGLHLAAAAASHRLDVDVGLDGDHALLADGGHDGAQQLLAGVELGLERRAHLAVGHLEVLAQLARIGHEREVTVVGDVGQLVLLALHRGHVHVVRGRADVLVLAARENVDADEVHLGVAVLARLRRGHLDHLAGPALEHDEGVLAQRRALLGVGGRRPGVTALEGVVDVHDAGHDLAAAVAGAGLGRPRAGPELLRPPAGAAGAALRTPGSLWSLAEPSHPAAVKSSHPAPGKPSA